MTERENLHKSIWEISESLRGSVDSWDFKTYVLGMMFYRYISENFRNEINRKNFNYANMRDEEAEGIRDEIIHSKGFFIYPSELFENVLERSKGDENISQTLERIFQNIEESSEGRNSEKKN